MWFFPLAFLLWPLIEIGGFIAVGRAIGLLPTLAAVIGTGVLGVMLLRFEGIRVLRQAMAALQSGKRPDLALAHAGLTALGGLLLVLPGFFSDIIGIALFVRPVRSAVIGLFAWMMGPVVVVETRSQSSRPGVVDLEPDEWQRRDNVEVPPAALAGPGRPGGTTGRPDRDDAAS